MKVSEFIRYNRRCPICDEPLGLYMQWIDSVCFRAKLIGDDMYQFDPFMGTNKDIGTDDLFNHFMTLKDDGECEVKFSSAALKREALKYNAYFYYLCNPAGIKKTSWGEHEMSAYKSCYYRSSPILDFKKSIMSDDLYLSNLDESVTDVVNKDETFCFNTIDQEGLEKVYILNLDSVEKKMDFWHYSISEKDKNTKYFKPNLFSKEMPLIPVKLKLEDRSKLIDRFESWIIMS
jgi:hypothetical protein